MDQVSVCREGKKKLLPWPKLLLKYKGTVLTASNARTSVCYIPPGYLMRLSLLKVISYQRQSSCV